MEKHAEDLERLCRDAGVTRAVFAGSSIGGYILFEYWRRHRERFAGLVLCGTRAQADAEQARAARLQSAEDVQKRGPAGFLDSMAEKLVGATTRRNRPDLAAEARAFMARMPVAGIVAIQQGMAARPDSVATLKTIDVPTLIVHGDEDTGVPVADAELMHRNIRGSRLEIIPQAGHYVVFEHPVTTARLMRQFLDGLRWE
jgi:pimeloyl-ACP methyl ester carboxylesterase